MVLDVLEYEEGDEGGGLNVDKILVLLVSDWCFFLLIFLIGCRGLCFCWLMIFKWFLKRDYIVLSKEVKYM